MAWIDTALKSIVAALSICLLSPCAMAQQGAIDPKDLTLEENINQPELPKKAVKDIKTHMQIMQEMLTKHGVQAKMMRDDQVIMVTLPCSELFSPNAIELKPAAEKYLRPFVDVLKYPTMYKVVIAVHSDDTGDDEYNNELTELRAIEIDDFFATMIEGVQLNLIPYGIGADEPLCENNSIDNRAKNRRVEIYIIPEWQMIETARLGKLI